MYSKVDSIFKPEGPIKKTKNILSSIATLGLTIPQDSSIRGSLKFNTSATQFCYNQVVLKSPLLLDETINSVVYDEKEGFWAIASERSFNQTSAAHQITAALVNSVAFVFSLKKIFAPDSSEVVVHQWPNIRLYGTPTDENSYFHELRAPQKYSINTSEIKAVLAPFHLVSMVKELFPNILVLPVGLQEVSLTEDPLELYMEGKSVIGQTILGPNYVRALHCALAQFPSLNQFGVHLTRLDIAYQPDLQLTIKENHDEYKKKWGMLTLRLKEPSDQQLNLIKELPGVPLTIESRNKENIYLCFCPENQKDAVYEYMKNPDSLTPKFPD